MFEVRGTASRRNQGKTLPRVPGSRFTGDDSWNGPFLILYLLPPKGAGAKDLALAAS